MGNTTKICEKIVQTNDGIHIHDSPGNEKIFEVKIKDFHCFVLSMDRRFILYNDSIERNS